MKIILRPYNILLLAAALLLAWCWLIAPSHHIDLHIHDTYLVTGTNYLSLFAACNLLMLAGLYLLLQNKMLSAVLTWLHIIITIGVLYYYLLYYFPGRYQNETGGMPRRYLELQGRGIFNFESRTGYETFVVINILFLAAQTLLLVNAIAGRRKRNGL